jgi:hypothetical protein
VCACSRSAADWLEALLPPANRSSGCGNPLHGNHTGTLHGDPIVEQNLARHVNLVIRQKLQCEQTPQERARDGAFIDQLPLEVCHAVCRVKSVRARLELPDVEKRHTADLIDIMAAVSQGDRIARSTPAGVAICSAGYDLELTDVGENLPPVTTSSTPHPAGERSDIRAIAARSVGSNSWSVPSPRPGFNPRAGVPITTPSAMIRTVPEQPALLFPVPGKAA